MNILYLASHGFAVRMLMQTNLLGELQQQGYRVGIVTEDASDPSVKSYCEQNGIRNIQFREKPRPFQSHIELCRRYLLEDVKKNPALYEKHLRMRDLASNHLSAKWKYFYTNTINQLVKAIPVSRKLAKQAGKLFLRFSLPADKLVETYQPDLVISTVPVNIGEAKLLHSASKAGVKTVTHILSWDNISCKGHFRELTDEYIVWGKIMKDELMKYYGIPASRIHETGVPHFDIHFRNKQALEQEGDKPAAPYLFFAMSSPYFAPREIDIVEHIAKWIEADTWPGLHFIIRPHPQNVIGNMADLNWLPRLQKLESDRVTVNYPEMNEASGINWSMKQDDMQSMSLLVGRSAIVLNSCSTMTIDGLCFDKPVVVTAFDNEEVLPWHISVKRVMEYEHYRNIVESGGVRVVGDYEELKKSIDTYIKDPATDSEKRADILFREVGTGDGKATTRVVSTIDKLLNAGKLDIAALQNKALIQH